jgi:hypothetical protein
VTRAGEGGCGHGAPGMGLCGRVEGLPTPNMEWPVAPGRRAGRRGSWRGGHGVRRATEQRTPPALCGGGTTGLNVSRRSPCPCATTHHLPFDNFLSCFRLDSRQRDRHSKVEVPIPDTLRFRATKELYMKFFW